MVGRRLPSPSPILTHADGRDLTVRWPKRPIQVLLGGGTRNLPGYENTHVVGERRRAGELNHWRAIVE
jgi:hypothetical protein